VTAVALATLTHRHLGDAEDAAWLTGQAMVYPRWMAGGGRDPERVGSYSIRRGEARERRRDAVDLGPLVHRLRDDLN
jgi:hypothetical protein